MGKIAGKLLDGAKNFLGSGVAELTPVFVVVAIIGVFMTMAGFKKQGTKVSSISFMLYILLKVVL